MTTNLYFLASCFAFGVGCAKPKPKTIIMKIDTTHPVTSQGTGMFETILFEGKYYTVPFGTLIGHPLAEPILTGNQNVFIGHEPINQQP